MLIKKRAGRRPALATTRDAPDYKRSSNWTEQSQISTHAQRTLLMKKDAGLMPVLRKTGEVSDYKGSRRPALRETRAAQNYKRSTS